MASEIKLADGKYTLIDALSDGGGFRALRYGEEWRDLAGDQLVYAMFCEIERLRRIISEITCCECGGEVGEDWEMVNGTPYCDLCAKKVREWEAETFGEN